jgi:hypothetical protein
MAAARGRRKFEAVALKGDAMATQTIERRVQFLLTRYARKRVADAVPAPAPEARPRSQVPPVGPSLDDRSHTPPHGDALAGTLAQHSVE